MPRTPARGFQTAAVRERYYNKLSSTPAKAEGLWFLKPGKRNQKGPSEIEEGDEKRGHRQLCANG